MALQNFLAFLQLKKCFCKIFWRFSNRKNAFAKFSGVSPPEKMLLQNFPAFLQLEKCPTKTLCYIVEVEIALEVSKKRNEIEKAFDNINLNKIKL